MRRKITSFLTMIVAMFVSINAFAQMDELQLKTVSVGTVVENFEPNTWYFLHQGRTPSQGAGGYVPTFAGEMPGTGGFLYDQGVGKDVLKIGVVNVEPESTATSKANYLVRFVPTDHEGAYNVQFGTGNWLTGPASNAQSAKFSSTDNFYDAGEFNIYIIDPVNAPGNIGFNVYDMSWRVDNNFGSESGINTGNTIVTWESGRHESVLDANGMCVSNSIWSVVEIEWGEADALEAAARDLEETYATYYQYSGTFVAGTEPGQYGEAEVAAFEAALQAAYNAAEDALSPDNVGQWTPEKLAEVKQALLDAYNAVLASKVESAFADGYYFIKTGMAYRNTVVDPETQEEVTAEVDKFMYSAISNGQIYGYWGSPDYDCMKLWYVKNLPEGRFDIVNMGTNARFDEVMRSTSVTMSTGSTAEMVITPVTTKDEVTYVNIHVYPQDPEEGRYLHQNNHNSGTGTGSTLVGWYNTWDTANDRPQGSEWVFLPVDEAEAQRMIEEYAPIQNHDLLVSNYKELLAEAKANLTIAQDKVSEALITENSQFSSPWTESSEGSLNNLLDGKTETFWHSAWSGGNVEAHLHYLQVALHESIDKDVYLTFSRRTDNGSPVANDHVTQWGVWGSNDAEAADDTWAELASLETPYNSSVINMTTSSFSLGGYRYLRFYADATSSNRGYWHVGEFQLYTVPEDNPNAQFYHMGEQGTNLLSVIESQADIEDDDIDINTYNTLKEAYDAFMAKFVDPTELRNTLKELAGTNDIVEIGTQPGFWADDSTAGAFKSTYDEAAAYDAAGEYTAEQNQNYIDQLNAKSKDIYASANGIQTSKWYKIRFGKEEEFDAHEWDKVAGNGTSTIPSLWGKYIALGEFSQEDGIQNIDPVSDRDAIGLGDNLYFLAEENIQVLDDAKFRFIAVGDSAYMLQNKTTGLFVRAAGTSGAVTLSAHPTLFNVRAIGYGQNVISAKNLTGSYQSNLHGQVSQNILVTWDVDYPGSRSGLYIEEEEAVAADYDGSEFNVIVAPGAVNTFCFPVEISVAEGQTATMWSVEKVEDTKVTLNQITGAVNGGRPFILVSGKVESYDATSEDTDIVVLKHGNAITATEPETDKPLKGSFYGQTVGAGVLVAEGNTFVISKRSNTAVGNNSAYIANEEAYTDLEATVEVIFGDGEDAIQTALADVSKSGAIYTLDGKLVNKSGNLNDAARLGKGIYILNGTKIVVK